MKFLCDRCKTRYSIGDDRVRGKILKIRCKNCANVITVREGMSDGGDAAEAPNGRTIRPTTMAPAISSTTPAKPPPALDEEWYVSIDGDQSGPYSLSEAQQWVGTKPHDAELHCWSEGFDDWLPVEKVSHFRGVRKKAPAAPAPSPRPPVPRAPAPRPAEEEPKPLFAATMASLERGAEPSNRLGVPNAGIARATPSGGVPVPRTNGAPAPTPNGAKGKGTGTSPVPAAAKNRKGPGPSAAKGGSGPAASPTPAKGGTGAIPSVSNGSGPARTGPNPRLQTQPGVVPAPVPGFDLPRANDPNDTATAVGGEPFPDDALPTTASSSPTASLYPVAPVSPAIAASYAPPPPMFPSLQQPPQPQPHQAAPAPMFPASAPAPSHLGAPAPLFPPGAAAAAAADDDGLEIAEVSRVVNLADLMRTAPKERARPANGAIGGRTGSVPRIDPAHIPLSAREGTASMARLSAEMLTPEAMADAALLAAAPPPPVEHHRRSLVALLVVAVLLLGGVGAVVAFALQTGDDPTTIGLGPTDQIDTTRPEDQTHHNPFVPLPPTGSNGSAGTSPNPHPNGSGSHVRPPNDHPGSGGVGSNGKVESDPLGPTSPLKPDEVEDMSSKQGTGATRCWERALRKQPYLQKDMKKVSVTITVDALGAVNNVSIAGMPSEDGGLGVCLQSFIRGWKFRQSSAGITAKFSMVFQNG